MSAQRLVFYGSSFQRKAKPTSTRGPQAHLQPQIHTINTINTVRTSGGNTLVLVVSAVFPPWTKNLRPNACIVFSRAILSPPAFAYRWVLLKTTPTHTAVHTCLSGPSSAADQARSRADGGAAPSAPGEIFGILRCATARGQAAPAALVPRAALRPLFGDVRGAGIRALSRATGACLFGWVSGRRWRVLCVASCLPGCSIFVGHERGGKYIDCRALTVAQRAWPSFF